MPEPRASLLTTDSAPRRRRVVVVGGGITGLAAAHRLYELDPELDIRLLEAQDRLGGVLQTETVDGYRCEHSADGFITNVPWALDLCRRVGIDSELLSTNDKHRQAFVVRRGKLEKLPEGFLILAPTRLWPIVTTPILSVLGKIRLLGEYFIRPRKSQSDESLASFAIRRFGREVFDRLIQPLMGGIYTADPAKLSIRATMPRFAEMEHDHGSLVRAALKERKSRGSGDSGARYSMFVAPRDGMHSLVQAIARRLPAGTVQINSPVERIAHRDDGSWSVWISGEEMQELEADAVILATPATRSARILATVDRSLAERLAQIPHAGCSIVLLGYRREQIRHPLDGFGFVVPLIENRRILSGSFSSVKYVGRAPDGKVLLRVFVGGACQPELANLPDEDLIALAIEEVGELLHIKGVPETRFLRRWPETMPQYHVGHASRIGEIEQDTTRWSGLGLAGNAYHGVGIPNCIHSGEQVAERIAQQLGVPKT